MVETGDQIHALASFLGVKCSKITYDGKDKIPVMKGKTGTRKGFSTVTKHLVRSSENQDLIGSTPAEKAVVDQWLEYKVCVLDRCPTFYDKIQSLGDLNTYLADKVYFLSHRLTLIDLVLYYTLHQTFVDMTFYDKQKYMHLSRWFRNIQLFKVIRQSLSPVVFSRTQLYTGSAH